MELVASLLWNQWQLWRGMDGNFPVELVATFARNTQPSLCLWCHSNVLGNGPQKGTQCSGHGDHDLSGMFAFGHQVAIPFAEPDLGLPADGLDRCGELVQA
jgi:hypothetical protein